MSRRRALQAILLAGPAFKYLPGFASGQAMPGPVTGYRIQIDPAAGSAAQQPGSLINRPFEGTRESLKNYEIPDWFRDAKFGIWAHWGPQSAIEAGDWYARFMYMQGTTQHKDFISRFGPLTKTGYKDTIPAWKAERFDPDLLLTLYRKAGARYFMTMGAHHDNFDLWNSKNPWNSVKMGPKLDIVQLFKDATLKQGLKFAISDHLWISPKWFSVSKGADKEGPFAGIPYDGADPRNAGLYGNSAKVWTDLPWDETGISNTWKKEWFGRMKDLIDQYAPDMLYCDGHIPFEELGLQTLAHLYNQSAAQNGGVTQAVYTSKRVEDSAVGTCVLDVERGVVDKIWPRPWQTDTCIGDWHYDRKRVGHYKTAKTIIDMLVDIVSKNGNLMLNFPLPASGMLDSEELYVLDGISQWMAVNSEGIYNSRPWKIYGTDPLKALTPAKSAFNEGERKDLTADSIRFTTRLGVLYAFFMGWPQSGHVVIKPLSTVSVQKAGRIDNIELLGHGKVEFSRDRDGLKIMLPAQKPGDFAFTLKITGIDLT